jgi:TfoX/Sxy family transcriptional regulator of competence genes
VKLPRADTEATNRFETLLPTGPGVEVRRMFGNPSAFVHRQLFFGVFGEDLFVRLGPQDRERLLALGGRPFAPMEGRPMAEYVVLPASIAGDRKAAAGWLARSLAFARALPPKPAKPSARRTATPRRSRSP